MKQSLEHGQFINYSPVNCDWLYQESWGYFWKIDIWNYHVYPDKPLTFITKDGIQIRPNKNFLTDFGSIPPPLMALPFLSRTRYLPAYLLHDSCYIEGGLWVKTPSDPEFMFQKFSKEQADALLFDMCMAWSAAHHQAYTIYYAVRIANVSYPRKQKKGC